MKFINLGDLYLMGKELKLWRATLLLLSVALAGSLWAALGGTSCDSCEGAAGAPGGRTLALFGVAFYAILLGAGLLAGPSRFVFGGILFASGVHAVLLLVLLSKGAFCAPCFLTGTAALGAMGVSFFLDPFNLCRASILLPVAAMAAHMFVFAAGFLPAAAVVAAERRDTLEAVETPPASPGQARMVIYSRPDCVYCQKLENDVLPGLQAKFAGALKVERRSAEEIPGLPTPTILITGAAGKRSFPGLPPVERLRSAILEALGESHERP